MRTFNAVFGSLLLLSAVLTSAQTPKVNAADSGVQESLRNLRLPELPGTVPVVYVPASKDRAIEYQKSLAPAHAWFEEQLGLRVPMVLYLLDQEAYTKVKGFPWPMPYSKYRLVPTVIVFPTRIEDLIGQQRDTKAPGEFIVYHEAGHNFARAAKISSGNLWVNELVANMFAAAYIATKYPDLKPAPKEPEVTSPAPRYTSLRDLDYVYTGVGFHNYTWFQSQIGRVADFLVREQKFPALVEKLRAEFPSDNQEQETLDQVVVHLEHVRPGARELLSPLTGPSSLARLNPSACREHAVDGKAERVTIAVLNESGSPLAIMAPDAGNKTLGAGKWWGFDLRPGEALRLPNNNCLIAGTEPALAVISKY